VNIYYSNVLFLAASILSAGAVDLVHDTFQDGDRTLQKPPQSLAYYCSHPGTHLSEGEGSLTLNGDSNRYIMAYLGDAGDYVDLKVGEALSLEISFRVEEGEPIRYKPLRMAWLNSGDLPGETRATTADAFGVENEGHLNYRGYQSAVGLFADLKSQILLAKRERPHSSLIMNMNMDSGYRRLSTGGQGHVDSGALYTAQLNISRIAPGEVELTAIVASGGTGSGEATEFFHSVVDADGPVFRFDAIAVGLNAGNRSVHQIELESLRIFKVTLP
jgi:hypothetical protein